LGVLDFYEKSLVPVQVPKKHGTWNLGLVLQPNNSSSKKKRNLESSSGSSKKKFQFQFQKKEELGIQFWVFKKEIPVPVPKIRSVPVWF
jgi:hypothetical protein